MPASPSDPGNLPQRRNDSPEANNGEAERVADHPQHIGIGPATQGKHAGDFVAQREFIRNGPATQHALSLLECCGVADKTAIFGATPARELDIAKGTLWSRFKTSKQASLLRFMALHTPTGASGQRRVQPLSRHSSRLSWHDMLNPGDSIKAPCPIYSPLFDTGSTLNEQVNTFIRNS